MIDVMMDIMINEKAIQNRGIEFISTKSQQICFVFNVVVSVVCSAPRRDRESHLLITVSSRKHSVQLQNWAHFPHIHFGLMPDQSGKKANVRQQEGEDVLMKDGIFAAANLGVSPY
ncbi:hypothetical protein IFM89_032002 [Coptis chinensis]|uniref:Uncharacterized protein n=1 Tax=Coptis chinensis TaxID=261450 RepID=A0A835IF87_9MAGN|nr:hypothetical protein IFM89_032002 [Coptis chinensis]